MANLNNPFGLRSLGLTESGGTPKLRTFAKVVGYATALYRGDAVNRVADGSIEASATPGTTLYTGVVLNGGAASKATSHSVIVSPDAVYVAQAKGTSGFAAADMGLNANLVLDAGDSASGKSGHQIDSTTEATTATLDVKLLDLFNAPDNEVGQYGRFEIVFNKHRMAPAVAGV